MLTNALQNPLQARLTLFFDGACEPRNPGGIAAFGWRLVDEAGLQVASDYGEACRGAGATNNVAEWHALTMGLRYLAACEWIGELDIRGDSLLVINQINGKWTCRDEKLSTYFRECLRILMIRIGEWKASWIPRDQNQEADHLSHRVYGNMKLTYARR